MEGGDDLADDAAESDSEPREVADGAAARYLELTRMLRAEFWRQTEVQDRLEASLEDLKKMVKEQEEFKKAEGWGERRSPARTRSRGGVKDDSPDLLEYLRAKAKEDQ